MVGNSGGRICCPRKEENDPSPSTMKSLPALPVSRRSGFSVLSDDTVTWRTKAGRHLRSCGTESGQAVVFEYEDEWGAATKSGLSAGLPWDRSSEGPQ
jgi:hypothetical protein